MEPKKIILKTGGNDFDLSIDQVGDAQTICYQYGWSIQSFPSVLPSGATYTVQVSDDGVKFDDLHVKSTGVNVDDSVCADHLNFLYIRVVTTSNGSTGNCSFKLVLK